MRGTYHDARGEEPSESEGTSNTLIRIQVRGIYLPSTCAQQQAMSMNIGETSIQSVRTNGNEQVRLELRDLLGAATNEVVHIIVRDAQVLGFLNRGHG